MSWGGSYGMSQRKAFHEPFLKETRTAVVAHEWSGDLSEIRTMVDTGRYRTHVIDVESAHLMAGCAAGVLQLIDYDKLGFGPDDFLPGAVHECGVGNVGWSLVLAYDADRMTDEDPKNWADFWNVEKFPGKRGMYKSPKFSLEFALLADGVSTDQIYATLRTPEGVDRAFAKLDQLKPYIVWWEAASGGPELLAGKEVVMTAAWSARIYSAIVEDDKNFKIIWDGQGMDYDYWVIPSGHPEADLAHRFIEFASRPERMGEQANYLYYGPLRKAAADHVNPEILPYLPTVPANTKNWFKSDPSFWADNRASLTARFNDWVAR